MKNIPTTYIIGLFLVGLLVATWCGATLFWAVLAGALVAFVPLAEMFGEDHFKN